MRDVIKEITLCIERGKVNKEAPYPPDLKDREGADELTLLALENQLTPASILEACHTGMQIVGDKFSRNEVFVPELLMAARAMNAVLTHLKPYFKSGTIKSKGIFVLGTVAGDLHDIGKNLVSMIVEGNGWQVIDLGVDVRTDKFLTTIENNPQCVVGLSALLTTTMANMAKTLMQIKLQFPNTRVIVGGAPLSAQVAEEMGADGYAANPQGAVNLLNQWEL